MENEVKEVLEGEVVNDSEMVNRNPSKAVLIGIAAATVGLFVVFRKKISKKMEKRMVKKLTKKGYTVDEPIQDSNFDEILEPVE